MKSVSKLFILFIFFISIKSPGQNVKNDPSIILPETKVIKIKDGFRILEGSSVSPKGDIFFVDYFLPRANRFEAGNIWKYDPKTNEFEIFASPSNLTVGTEFDANGHLICAEFIGRRITKRNVETREASFLALSYEDKPLNGPNDLTITEKGQIYFTDYPYVFGTKSLFQRFGGVYRIDSVGIVKKVVSNAGTANGIVISPDQKTLYIGTNDYDIWGNSAILAYDVMENGDLTFRSIFVDYKDKSVVDGLTVDKDGNVYASQLRGTDGMGVKVYSPKGDLLAFIQTPTGVQNVTFGKGEFKKTLFMVGQTTMYKVQLEKEGYHILQRNKE